MAGRGYMARYPGTPVASTTLPFGTLIGTATVRPQVYEIGISSSATPADNAVNWQLQRCSTTGTAGSNPVPVNIDSGDTTTPLAIQGLLTFGAGPTLTGSAFVWDYSCNQRTTLRWVAVPGKELIGPATASNGFALMTPTVVGAVLWTAVIYYNE